MRAVAAHRVENAGHITWRHRAVRNAAPGSLDLDHRLQPVEAPRAGSDNLQRDVASAGRIHRGNGNFISADRDCARIARNEDAQTHRCASAISASTRSASSLPYTRPSKIADG